MKGANTSIEVSKDRLTTEMWIEEEMKRRKLLNIIFSQEFSIKLNLIVLLLH